MKTYADLNKTIVDAVTCFRDEVREGKFPDEEHAFS